MTSSVLTKRLPFSPDDLRQYSVFSGRLPFTNTDFRILGEIAEPYRLPFTTANHSILSVLSKPLPFDVNLIIYSALTERTPIKFEVAVDPPVITSEPMDEQIDVAISATIILMANKPIRNADGTEITNANVEAKITFTDDVLVPHAFTATINAAKTEIQITPTTALDNDMTYILTFSDFEDVEGNEVALFTMSFTTAEVFENVFPFTFPFQLS